MKEDTEAAYVSQKNTHSVDSEANGEEVYAGRADSVDPVEQKAEPGREMVLRERLDGKDKKKEKKNSSAQGSQQEAGLFDIPSGAAAGELFSKLKISSQQQRQ